MFGKKSERRRQWALLGPALRGLSPLDAMDFLDRAFGSKVVPWAQLREELAAGATLYGLARKPALKTPEDVLNALEDGEQQGDLPSRLAELFVDEEAAGPLSAVDDGIVTLVNAVLVAATEGGATGLMLRRLPEGDGQVKVYQGHAWTLHSRHPAPEYAAMLRRFLVLCAQPYWAPGPGTFRMRLRQGLMEFRVTPDGKGGLGIEIAHEQP